MKLLAETLKGNLRSTTSRDNYDIAGRMNNGEEVTDDLTDPSPDLVPYNRPFIDPLGNSDSYPCIPERVRIQKK
jgi:hypothetical protein